MTPCVAVIMIDPWGPHTPWRGNGADRCPQGTGAVLSKISVVAERWPVGALEPPVPLSALRALEVRPGVVAKDRRGQRHQACAAHRALPGVRVWMRCHIVCRRPVPGDRPVASRHNRATGMTDIDQPLRRPGTGAIPLLQLTSLTLMRRSRAAEPVRGRRADTGCRLWWPISQHPGAGGCRRRSERVPLRRPARRRERRRAAPQSRAGSPPPAPDPRI